MPASCRWRGERGRHVDGEAPARGAPINAVRRTTRVSTLGQAAALSVNSRLSVRCHDDKKGRPSRDAPVLWLPSCSPEIMQAVRCPYVAAPRRLLAARYPADDAPTEVADRGNHATRADAGVAGLAVFRSGEALVRGRLAAEAGGEPRATGCASSREGSFRRSRLLA